MRKLKHKGCFEIFTGWCLTCATRAPISLGFVLKEGNFVCLRVSASLSTASFPKAGISDLRSLGMPVSRNPFPFHVKMDGVLFGISRSGISSHLRIPTYFLRSKLPAPQSLPSAPLALALLTDLLCLHPLSIRFRVTRITRELQIFGTDFI